MMIQLLKKDWRIYRVAVLANLVFLVLIYGLILTTETNLKQAAHGAARVGLGVTALLASLYGACAFAIERRERSANFLGVLPVTRMQIVASKVIISFSAIVAFLLLNYAIMFLASTPAQKELPAAGFAELASWTLFSFSIAWVLSTFMESATLVFGITFAVVIAWLMGVQFVVHEFGISWQLEGLIFTAATGIPSLSFFGGTIYYLRRIEP